MLKTTYNGLRLIYVVCRIFLWYVIYSYSLAVQAGWEELDYIVSEGVGIIALEVCAVVTNPPPDEPLIFDVPLSYVSERGTTGKYIYVRTCVQWLLIISTPKPSVNHFL